MVGMDRNVIDAEGSRRARRRLRQWHVYCWFCWLRAVFPLERPLASGSFFARCWVLLRSTRTTFFWETTQCFHISAMLGTTVDTILRESTWFLAGSSLALCTWHLPVRCLPRRVQENWIFRCRSAVSTTTVVFSGLVLLVMTHFALRFFSLFSGPDAWHHGRFGPEGQLRSGGALVVDYASGMFLVDFAGLLHIALCSSYVGRPAGRLWNRSWCRECL